jgi:hypothetical protein
MLRFDEFRHLCGVACAAVAMFVGATAVGQSSRTIMRGNPDGTHEVLMLTSPDYNALRTPDFSAADLSIMKKRLQLSDEQESEFKRRIEQYLLEFRALTRELANQTDAKAEFIPEEEKKAIVEKGNAADDMPDMNLDGIDVPPGVDASIGFAISRSSSDDPNVPAPPPQVEVSVTLDSPEGDEIPQSIIDQIRERANDVASRMVEYLIAEEEARRAGDQLKKPLIEASGSFDEIKAEHDSLMLKVEEFLKAKAQLRSQFVLDAQASLAQGQIERWPALERALYRQRSLPKGLLPGESIDLVKLVEEWKLTDRQREQLSLALEGVEIILDEALHHRDALLATATNEIDQAIANRKPDLALTLTDRVTARRLAVRNINRTHIDQFAVGSASAEGRSENAVNFVGLGEQFRLAALKLCYPKVYMETRGVKAFAAVRKMDGLDESIRAGAADLEAAYQGELSSVNEQLRATIDRETATGSRRGIEHLKASMEGVESEAMSRGNPERELFVKRAELDDRYIELLSQLVGEERSAALPKQRKNRDPVRIKSTSAGSFE